MKIKTYLALVGLSLMFHAFWWTSGTLTPLPLQWQQDHQRLIPPSTPKMIQELGEAPTFPCIFYEKPILPPPPLSTDPFESLEFEYQNDEPVTARVRCFSFE